MFHPSLIVLYTHWTLQDSFILVEEEDQEFVPKVNRKKKKRTTKSSFNRNFRNNLPQVFLLYNLVSVRLSASMNHFYNLFNFNCLTLATHYSLTTHYSSRFFIIYYNSFCHNIFCIIAFYTTIDHLGEVVRGGGGQSSTFNLL